MTRPNGAPAGHRPGLVVDAVRRITIPSESALTAIGSPSDLARVPTIDDVRRIALALPEATEELTWGTDLTFRFRGRIFAITGEGASGVSVKATIDDQAALVASDPDTFAPSAYTGRFGWITVQLSRVEQPMLEQLLRAAWRRTAGKRLAATLPPD
jgi:hypothetical protein